MISIVDATGARHEGLACEITMPLRGNWIARATIGIDTPPVAGQCTIEIERDGEPGVVDTFVGTLRYGSTWQGRADLVIVGGGGGLIAAVSPRHYAVKTGTIDASLIVGDVVAAAGEELSTDVDLEGLELGQWTRAEVTPAVTLGLVADAFALGWRVKADGTVWIGAETWPTADPADYAFEGGQDPDARTIDVAPNRATLAPGMTVLGQQIVRVTYTIGAGLRARLLYGDDDRSELAAVVKSLIPPDVYASTCGATVVSQNTDDTLDVNVDDIRLPALRRIKFRSGIIGSRVLLAPGSRVRVGFESSSPSGAFAFAPDCDPTASRGIARTGDVVVIGTISISGTPPQLSYTTIGGTTGPASSVTLTGVIATGSTENLLR